jgi:hypothetical protein
VLRNYHLYLLFVTGTQAFAFISLQRVTLYSLALAVVGLQKLG